MREAVIVTTARTPIGKAYRGAFNDTQAQTLGGHVIQHAAKRAGVVPCMPLPSMAKKTLAIRGAPIPGFSTAI